MGVIAEGNDLVHADGMAADHAIALPNKDRPFFLACASCVHTCRWWPRQILRLV